MNKEPARNVLIAFSIKYKDDWDKILFDITNKVDIDIKKYLKGIDTSEYITLMDNDYPNELKKVVKPPFTLKYYGNLKELTKSNIIFVDRQMLTNENSKLNYCWIYKANNLKQYVLAFSNSKSDLAFYSNNYEDLYKLGSAIAHGIYVNSIYNSKEHNFIKYIGHGIAVGKDIYVRPSIKPSINNQLIKEGANLCDCEEDLYL